jgi:cytoskeletal protein CcmA (bactofilin family)
MFGSKKTETTPAAATTLSAKTTTSESTNALNSLVKGTTVEGTIFSESDIRVDGTIKGNLTCKAKVIVGPTGVIDGEVKCQNAMIEGKIFGKLRVTELLSVKETAEIVGDVVTGKLLVQPGAVFNVTCNMKDVSENGHSKQPKKEVEVSVNGKN